MRVKAGLGIIGALVAAALVAASTPASALPAAAAVVAVVTDPADGVPRTDPVPLYDDYQALADPGASAAGYFQPYWYDTQGRHIQAHGGQIVTTQENGQTVYYWYGEDRTNGYYGSPGVAVYRSTDTYNWENLGDALRGVSDNAELTTDPYFVDLYGTLDGAGQPKTDLVQSLSYYLNTDQNWTYSAIFERPKVLYNAKTGKWVMWWHADGRTSAGGSMYARSMAAVAVADSPAGPFKMTGAYRMYNRSNYQACTTSAVPGQARDMTVFQDADGTAYIVYSSEENNSLYVSKLNEDYTNVEHTTTTDPVRTGSFGGSASYTFQYSESGQYPHLFADGTADAPVRGTDFQIVKECGHLEAPAMFTHGGKYYVLASGATSWAPNPQTYYSADDILGGWIRGVQSGDAYENVSYSSIPEGGDGLLSVGDVRRTTFGSQSTNVLTLGDGKYVYMGDRWNEGKSDSTYVWLPITVAANGVLEMRNPATEDPARWGSGWGPSYWDDKGVGGKIWSVSDAAIPSAVRLGATPAKALPATLPVTVDGQTHDVAVTWDASFTALGSATITGILAGDADFGPGRRVTRTVDVWDYGVTNLAPGAAVTASSRSDLARTVVDLNVKGKGWDDWLSGGVYPKSSWLAFDWTSTQRPRTILVHTYRDGTASWPSTVKVQYKANGAWVDTQVSATLDQTATVAPVATLDVSSLPATTGIRVQLQTATNVWQSISEVQIWGDASQGGNVCRVPGASVSASFSQTDYSAFPATNACDGSTSTPWSTWAIAGGPNPVTFTLLPGTAYEVSSVAFTNGEGSPKTVGVRYRGVDGVWRDTSATAAPIAAAGTQTTVGFTPVVATAVRLTFATPSTYLKIPEISVMGTLAAAPPALPVVEASVEQRCAAGKVVLVTSVTNTDDTVLAVDVSSPFGAKSFTAVQPGKTVSVASTTKQAQVAAGSIQVTAADGSGTSTSQVAYPAKSCG
ncbi:glycoside hydrolase family 43 protein [Microbacterium sp. B2969]|uniref:Glycoside hydrolase family 43 protein n=1 Tax=Microbacterium alkaliflavum TaxID=3248839 RepID=A0ABW7QBL0_9MICO